MNTREAQRISNMKYARTYITTALYKVQALKYEKALAYLMVTLNLSRRTAKEMVDSLIGIDEFRLNNDNIVFPINTPQEDLRQLTHNTALDILKAKPVEESNTLQESGGTPSSYRVQESSEERINDL